MNMRNKYFVIILALISSLLLFNCNEVKDDISEPEEVGGVHPEGFGQPSSDNFHTFAIQAKGWDMTGCKKCHASDYSGGVTEVSCLDCHTSSEGPEACNTCHGVFADETRIAPPTDLSNNFETSAKGVGAHTAHVYENELGLGIGCYECHPGDTGEGDYILTHSDGLPAEMSFGSFASSGLSAPTYNSDLSCSNTYCHGNFEFGTVKGNNFSPVWNIVDGSQGACGTCHGKDGTPTPIGHFGNFSAENCVTCHPATFNEDGSLNKFNHINGEANIN